jgi:hypothetical protein
LSEEKKITIVEIFHNCQLPRGPLGNTKSGISISNIVPVNEVIHSRKYPQNIYHEGEGHTALNFRESDCKNIQIRQRYSHDKIDLKNEDNLEIAQVPKSPRGRPNPFWDFF